MVDFVKLVCVKDKQIYSFSKSLNPKTILLSLKKKIVYQKHLPGRMLRIPWMQGISTKVALRITETKRPSVLRIRKKRTEISWAWRI